MLPEFGIILWQLIAMIIIILWIGSFLTFVFWLMPPIARRFTRLRFSKSSVAFIQQGGRVNIYASNEELPEGVVYNDRGWFLKSVPPFRAEVKRSVGRPRKEESQVLEKAEVDEALDVILRAPILEGFGKQVFFGSSDVPLLSNLETLAELTPQNPKSNTRHSILNTLKEVIPATIGRTQLDALATLNYLRGLKVGKGEMIRLIVIIACLIALVATIGLVFWFITK